MNSPPLLRVAIGNLAAIPDVSLAWVAALAAGGGAAVWAVEPVTLATESDSVAEGAVLLLARGERGGHALQSRLGLVEGLARQEIPHGPSVGELSRLLPRIAEFEETIADVPRLDGHRSSDNDRLSTVHDVAVAVADEVSDDVALALDLVLDQRGPNDRLTDRLLTEPANDLIGRRRRILGVELGDILDGQRPVEEVRAILQIVPPEGAALTRAVETCGLDSEIVSVPEALCLWSQNHAFLGVRLGRGAGRGQVLLFHVAEWFRRGNLVLGHLLNLLSLGHVASFCP